MPPSATDHDHSEYRWRAGHSHGLSLHQVREGLHPWRDGVTRRCQCELTAILLVYCQPPPLTPPSTLSGELFKIVEWADAELQMRKLKCGGVYTSRGALIAFTYVQYQSGLYMITLQDAGCR